jgi:hypothetical protein
MFLFQVCLNSTESSVPVSHLFCIQHTNELLLVPERDEQLALYYSISWTVILRTIRTAKPGLHVSFMFQFTSAIMLPCYRSLMHCIDVKLCYFCKIIFNRFFLAEKWWKWSYSNTGRALLVVVGYQSCPNWFRWRRNTARKYSKTSLSLVAFIKPYHGYVMYIFLC